MNINLCSVCVREHVNFLNERTRTWPCSCLFGSFTTLRTMAALKSGEKVPPNLIGASLKIYTSKWLLKISRKLENGSGLNSGSDPSSSNSRLLLESIITLLPTERNAVSCSFLLKLLKGVNVFQASGSSKLELARRVALQVQNY
ncbi:putative NPH3 domain-containing protein [Helianthus annuus]|nr:putative NPH3 domain-containing protein [Helianthus annuus]